MKLTSHHERFLRMAAQRPRKITDFTHIKIELAYLSAPIVEQYMDAMVEEGLLLLIGDEYWLAPKGRDYIEAMDAEKAVYARANPGRYTGPVFNIRPGGLDFMKHPSRGIG